jgi:hypothetical protein
MWESENQDESPLMTTDNFHGIDRLATAKTVTTTADLSELKWQLRCKIVTAEWTALLAMR